MKPSVVRSVSVIGIILGSLFAVYAYFGPESGCFCAANGACPAFCLSAGEVGLVVAFVSVAVISFAVLVRSFLKPRRGASEPPDEIRELI